MRSLQWLGLPWDEGPDVGGPHAPYRQSERAEIYRTHAEMLLESGHAYRSFLDDETLSRIRAEQRDAGHAFHDVEGREMSAEESARRAEAGESFVVRLRTPLDGECRMQDLLRGPISKDWASIDDQILLKSDGFPTYHLANVVDDHAMEISHVIRGEEWISSLPKHVLLYQAFGWEPPVFCHLPLLRNPDKNKSKLSKRKNPTSIEYYRRAGVLPHALVNFLGMLGWSMPDGEEKFTVPQMMEKFRLEDVSLGGPVFDVAKLKWLNGRYLREDYDAAGLTQLLREWTYNDEMFERIAPLAQPRLETLSDWAALTTLFFSDDVDPNPDDLALKNHSESESAEVLQLVSWRLEGLRSWNADAIEDELKVVAEKLELKLRDVLAPLYVALSGQKASTPLYQSMEILGPDMSRIRVRRAIEKLGGLSAKKLKALEKRRVALFG